MNNLLAKNKSVVGMGTVDQVVNKCFIMPMDRVVGVKSKCD